MGYARYVGRVGGLAVALGIGVAVATAPGVALAGPSDPDSSNSPSPGSPSSSPDSGSSPSAGSPSSPGSDTQSPSASNSPESRESSGDDEASGDDSDGAAGDEESEGSDASKTDKKSETVKDKKSGSDASTSAVTPKKPKRAVAHTPSDSDVRKGEPAADSSPAVQPKSEPIAQPTLSGVSVGVGLQSASSSASTVQDLPKVEPAPEPDVRPLSSTVLSAVGLAPSADGDAPEVPGESPLLLAGLAAFRRQTQQSLVGDEASALKAAEPSQSSLMVADSGGESMLLMAAAVVNSAPSVSPVVGVPDQGSGAVSVSLNAVDAEGNPLTYTVMGQPVSGSLAVAGAGVFTYTPTQVARLAAGSTTAPDFDSFTVSVSDGQGGVTPVSVSVPVLPAVWVNQASASNVTGASPYGVAVVGNTAYVANQGANTVTVINTLTGQTIGAPIVVGSAPTGAVASLDGAYVFVSNRTSGTVSVIRTSDNTVVDINPATPTVVDSIKVASQPEMLAINTSAITNASGTVLAAAGTRLYVANYGSNTVSVIDISNPAAPKVIDANSATPTVVDAITVGANPRGITFAQTPNGPRVYVVNRTAGTVSVIDAVTNKPIDLNPATPTTVDAIKVGTTPQLIVINGDGTRAYVSNYGSNSVSIIDTATNKVVDANPATPSTVDAIAVPSTPIGVALSKDGSLLYVANGNDRISVIDTKTRAVISTVLIDTAPETNFHTLAVRTDGALVITDLADRALRVVAYQRGNTAPVVIANPTVGAANSSNGAVTGLINIKDWDGDPLSYSAVVSPAKGSLSFNPATGSYTYTPTTAARDAAATGGPTTDTFTIRATDNYNTYATTANVTVPISPTPPAPPPSPSPTIPATNKPVIVGVSPRDVVVSGNYAYVGTDYGDFLGSPGTVSVIDTTTKQLVKQIPVGGAPVDLAVSPDGTRLYTANHVEVVVIDTATNEIIDRIAVPDQRRGVGGVNYVTDVAVSPNANSSIIYALRVYHDSAGSYGSITKIDTDTGVMSTTWTPYVSDLDVTPDGTRIYAAPGRYAAEQGDDTAIKVYDATTLTEVGTVAFTPLGSGSYVSRLAVSGTRAYALVSPAGSYDKARLISVIDTTTNTEIATIAAPTGVWDVEVSPDGERVYVTRTDGRAVMVIDAESATVTGQFTTNQSISGTQWVAEGPDGTVYVTGYAMRTLYVVNVGDTTPPNNVPPSPRGSTGSFDPATGVTTGNVNVVDQDGDTLRYYLLYPPSYGTVTFNEQTGDYVYTPYLTDDGYNVPYQDGFQLVVTDGNYVTTANVVVQTFVDPYMFAW